MKFKTDFLYNYLLHAPAPLAIERALECELLSKKAFRAPILDIGCGEGLFAHVLFDEKIDLGIDPDQRELDKCKEFGAYKELIKCFGNEIPRESATFNTIFSNSVLEHIVDLESVLKEANRLLAEDGKMYITVPTDLFDKNNFLFRSLSFLRLTSLAENYRVFFNKFWKHYHFYNVSNWKAVFERNGFVLINYKEYNSRSLCMTNDFLAPFCIPYFLNKKLLNRWFLFPGLRKLIAKVLVNIIKGVVSADEKNDGNWGLVFFEISKAPKKI